MQLIFMENEVKQYKFMDTVALRKNDGRPFIDRLNGQRHEDFERLKAMYGGRNLTEEENRAYRVKAIRLNDFYNTIEYAYYTSYVEGFIKGFKETYKEDSEETRKKIALCLKAVNIDSFYIAKGLRVTEEVVNDWCKNLEYHR